METVRTVGDFELVYEPLMRMFRIVQIKSQELSMWFNSETAEELKEMNDKEFSSTAEEYVKQAEFSD